MSISRISRRNSALAVATAAAAAGVLVAAWLSPAAQAAPTAAAVTAKPTIVLVHGAFADASGWDKVAERLQRDGYTVVAPANPLRGLPQDSAYIASVLKSISGPVVVVGHSYGGAVVTQAAAGDSQVKALVYIAALMPDQGENLGELAARFPGGDLQSALRPVPYANVDGTGGADLYISPEKFRAVFAADLPVSRTALMAAEQRPVSASAFGDTASAAAWRTVPTWAMVAAQDMTLGVELERFEARRAGAHTVEVNSSHAAMISHPHQVADLIEEAAGPTAGR
jgi:pimeloyl-ACP methyl ester carboxylesterase